jgi:RimJ/RimL family protein N-acetyltransferase
MTIQEIKESYSICGLVCSFCSYRANCPGCRCKDENCEIKACCNAKGLNYCYECKEFPCGKEMFQNIRIQAFNTVAKNEGLEKLAEYLCANSKRGIVYHKEGSLTGDYDRYSAIEDIIYLLKNGKPNPYAACPIYESEHFRLRLVSPEDAADLLSCYSNPEAQAIFNADRCTSDFRYSSVDEMKRCIDDWLNAYKARAYVRFSIIEKKSDKAVGTVEIFGSDEKSGHSVLRIDIHPQYENQENLGELLCIADDFFEDFGCWRIVTKAIPEAAERISALKNHGYTEYPANREWERENYYIKRRK